MEKTVKSPATIGTAADFLADQEHKSLLRFLTCGSVDDGKSTLIGRLLYDTRLIFEDQLAALKSDSRKFGAADGELDLSLLVDGLEAEREQGITIDVAYRYFTTPRRKFIVADTPGHAQYTRNMATGASTADLAVVLVDARKGVQTQTRRHTFIASLLGIRHVVLAVNKIDLVDFSGDVFDGIVADYLAFARDLGFASIQPIPLSARLGDNVTSPSPRLGWYEGPCLLEHLETVQIDSDALAKPFRFPVQYVNRADADFRGFAGTITSGLIAVGDTVVVAKSGKQSRLKRIVTYDGDLPRAGAGEAVTLVLEDEIDVSRGNILVGAEDRPEVADRFAANVVWFGDQPLQPGRSYLLRTETDLTPVTISRIEHRTNVDTFAREDAGQLELNEIGLCHLQAVEPIAFDPYAVNRGTGAFILIDRITNATVGAGMIEHALRNATNVHLQFFDIDRHVRAEQKFQKPVLLWFTGLPAAGKSTIANRLEQRLHALGKHTYLLDGDNVRHGLNSDLGFSDHDRSENIRRVGEVARLMVDAGLIVIAAFISPFRSERDRIRARLEEGEFVEIFVDTPIGDCIARDPKGLYAKALKGEITSFTGIDSPYEAPLSPELHLRTGGRSVDELVAEIEEYLTERGIVGGYRRGSRSV